jgi:hypothetical protein
MLWTRIDQARWLFWSSDFNANNERPQKHSSHTKPYKYLIIILTYIVTNITPVTWGQAQMNNLFFFKISRPMVHMVTVRASLPSYLPCKKKIIFTTNIILRKPYKNVVLFHFAVVLSVLLRYTHSVCPFWYQTHEYCNTWPRLFCDFKHMSSSYRDELLW